MSLAQITKETRLILKYGGSALVVLLVLFLLFKGGVFIKDTFFPAPEAPPRQSFGKLPPIAFPDVANPLPTFSINTVSGALPVFTTTTKVYKLIKLTPSITSLQAARARAASLGYVDNQQELSPSQFKWSKPSENNSLSYNIVSLNFSVSSDFLVNPAPVPVNPSERLDMTEAISGFIDTLGSDKSDIDFEASPITYYSANAGDMVETAQPTEANVTRMFLKQKQVDKMNIYYPTTDPSMLYFTFTGDKPLRIVEAQYNHFTPILSEYTTYYLKTADAAYKDLQDGKGFIVNPTTDTTVEITDIFLGYYLGADETQEYLMPIIIFKGKNNFEAYVSGVAN